MGEKVNALGAWRWRGAVGHPAPLIGRTAQPLEVSTKTTSRWRAILGWIGIVAGAAVFVAALALRLDDPALVVALMLGLRGGRLILDIDS